MLRCYDLNSLETLAVVIDQFAIDCEAQAGHQENKDQDHCHPEV
jgi:hypothetical protein